MSECENCEHRMPECEDWCWYFTCEKGLEMQDDDFECEDFEPKQEIKTNYKLEVPTECISQCSNQSLQGCTIHFKDIKDLKCGDIFVLKSLSHSRFEKGEIWNAELQKVYKVGE